MLKTVRPLLLPLMVAIGIHPIHFAAIIGVNLAIGGVTPPYASILYLGMRVGKVEFSEILGPAVESVASKVREVRGTTEERVVRRELFAHGPR